MQLKTSFLAYLFMVIHNCKADEFPDPTSFQSSCTTPDGQSGTCKLIHNCEPIIDLLNNLLKKKNVTDADVNFIKDSKCGTEGNHPKVCCPTQISSNCLTPNGEPGRCVGVYNCSHVLEMLQAPVTWGSLDYVKSLKTTCAGTAEEIVVCCSSRISRSSKMINEVDEDCANRVSEYPLEPNNECCGVNDNNKKTLLKLWSMVEHPWLAIIDYEFQTEKRFMCSGALISRKYVLTSGHCLTGDVLIHGIPKRVRLGEFAISDTWWDKPVEFGGEKQEDYDGVTTIDIEDIVPHPDYFHMGRWGEMNDIGLVKLKEMAPYNYFIRPICLPSQDWAKATEPSHFAAVNWGNIPKKRTPKPNDVDRLPFKMINLDRVECDQDQFDALGVRINASLHICADGSSRIERCRSDSGNPLVYEGITSEVVGVYSFVLCGLNDYPAVYTNVFHYIGWIRNNTKA